MANTIRIKRSASTNTPGSLTQGELANSESGSPNGINELFIGTAGPAVTKIIRNLNGAPAEPTAGLAGATPVTGDYLVFEDVTDSQGKRVLFSATPLSIFNNDNSFVETITAGVGLIGSGTATDPVLDLDFSELTDMTASISGTTEFILQDGTTESRKTANEIDLQFFLNTTLVETITAGTGLVGSGTTTVTLDLDFSELTDMTADISGTTEFILQDGTTESRKAASEIELSKLNNDIQNIMGTYAFSTTITAGDPGPGTIRFNSATPASVTQIYIDDLEDNGNDWGWILSNLASNDILVIKSHVDAADYLIVQINSGPTDNTGYWTLPVTVLFSGTLPTATDLLNIEVQWFSQGTAGTVTSVTAGTGLVNSGTASAVVLDFDFSELTDMTASISGTTEFILQDGTTESRKTANEIQLQFFDNSVAEFVSENDTLVVADWNWVLDEDTLVSNSDTHVPTQQSVKAYVDSAVSSALTYQGGYNAATNTPDLDTSPSGITTGDTYTVTADGNFFTEAVQVGDMLIAEQDNPTLLSHWTVVQDNIGPASETAPGYIEIATQAEVDAASSTLLAVVPSYLHNTTFDGGTF